MRLENLERLDHFKPGGTYEKTKPESSILSLKIHSETILKKQQQQQYKVEAFLRP